MNRRQREQAELLYLQGETSTAIAEEIGVSLDEVERYLRRWLSEEAPGVNLTNP